MTNETSRGLAAGSPPRGDDRRPSAPGHAVRAFGAGLAGLLCVLGLMTIPQAAAQTSPAAAGSSVSQVSGSIAGSWYVPTYFNYGPYQGQTENTLITFVPGGGLVESNPINFSHTDQGNWSVNQDGTYSYNLVEFTFDSATHGVCQTVNPRVTVKVTQTNQDGVPIAFASTNVVATLNNYNPQTGQLTSSFRLPGVASLTGQRITANWAPPSTFPAEPPPPSPTPCS